MTADTLREPVTVAGQFLLDVPGIHLRVRERELILAIEAEAADAGYIKALADATYMIEQARDTVRAEAADLPSGRAGIAAREHSLALIESLVTRRRLLAAPGAAPAEGRETAE